MMRFVEFSSYKSKEPVAINPDKVEGISKYDEHATCIHCVGISDNYYIVDMPYHAVIAKLENNDQITIRPTFSHATPSKLKPGETYKEMVRLIKLNRPISAIAVAKTAFGLSVHEAKDLVEAIISTKWIGEKDELA